jgi:hypothetical protein
MIHEKASIYSSGSKTFICVTLSSKWYVTSNSTVEMAIVSDVYYKRNNSNAFSSALHNIATYSKNIKFLISLGTDNFWGQC